MKQLLSLSKDRKETKKPNIKQMALMYQTYQEDQQQNFIYQQDDKNDGPSDQQIRTYAEILGIKLPEQQDLLYLAQQCLNQPMPAGWRCEEDQRGQIIYVNENTGQVSFDHPCDEIFRQKVIAQRKKKIKDLKKGLPKINIQKSKTSFVDNVFNEKNHKSLTNSQLAEKSDEKIKLVNSSKDNNIEKAGTKKRTDTSQLFLYDDDNDEPVNPFTSKKRRQDMKFGDVIPEKRINTAKPKQLQAAELKLSQFKKKSNPALLLTKRQQIEQKIRKKYEKLDKQLDSKYIQKLKQTKAKQTAMRDQTLEDIGNEAQISKLQRKKKEIEMKLMLQHSQQLERLRQKYQRQYKVSISELSSQYQVQNLFTELSKCRQFFNQHQKQPNNLNYLQQMQNNLKLVNKLQTEKITSDFESQCQDLMHNIIITNYQGTIKPNWQKQSELIQSFEQAVNKIAEQIKVKEGIGLNETLIRQSKKIQTRNQEQVAQRGGQEIGLYRQLQDLKRKLRDLQEENNTQRSNLSEKQNKLYELLQNKVSSSSSRSERK